MAEEHTFSCQWFSCLHLLERQKTKIFSTPNNSFNEFLVAKEHKETSWDILLSATKIHEIKFPIPSVSKFCSRKLENHLEQVEGV